MVRHLVGFVCLWLMFGAHAQSLPVAIAMRTLQGCTLFHPGSDTISEVTLTKIGNHQCANGAVNGAVFYGLSWKLAPPQQEEKGFIGMRAGIMENGRFDGLRMSINQGGRLFLSNSAAAASLRIFERESPQYSLDALLAAIAELAPQAAGRNPAANSSYLQSIARAWDANPYGLMKEFTDPGSEVTFQNLSWVGRTGGASAPAITTQRDDPKTTGRGGRGG